jgi:multiple sugar transport system substrate-binding protein
MAALDDAVKSATDGKRTPQQALDNTAAQWQQITAKYGKDQQLAAYRKSLKTTR